MTSVLGLVNAPVKSSLRLCVNMNKSSRLAFVATGGSFVSSENRTVIVSPAEKIASKPSGSSAVSNVIDGPAFRPKLPINAEEVSIDASDVPASFFRLPPAWTVIVSAPTVAVPPEESGTVINNTDGVVTVNYD